MPRKVKPDERKLWDAVAATTTPFSDRPKPKVRIEPAKKLKSEANPTPKPISPFRIGSKAMAATSISPPKVQAPKMDAKAFSRMKRGKLAPEGKIDLHGLTVAEAQPALTNFILRAAQCQYRLVLVITGKGRDRDDAGPIPVRTGILRQNLPMWLKRAPLNSVVLEVVEAHQRHGGGGAFYVYLRRAR